LALSKGVEFGRQDAEGRAFRLVTDKKEAGEQSAGGQQCGNPRSPVSPELARQGAEEGAFVDQAEIARGKGEKIIANQVDRSRLNAPLCGHLAQYVARGFNRFR
jgi:hypothetical protein